MLELGKIHDIELIALKQFKDDRGMVMHMVRNDSEYFTKFGEVYFSVVNPGVTKGWKQHFEATQLFAVPKGLMKIVLFDNREDSPTKGISQSVEIGIDQYSLLKIPPKIWYAFKAISEESAMIANCSSLAHDPNESTTLPLENEVIPYSWQE